MAMRRSSSKAQEDIAFPTKQLIILGICRFSEPIAFTSILAYTYVMVQDLFEGDDRNASFYAGLLVSAFAVAEALTAMVWGVISDKVGRKPIVLIGLAGTALSSLIFGFATKYWVALLARFVGGALNGNVAVMQTMVAEMVKKPEHEPRAYAVQPFVWAFGSIIGSAMGGFLAQPAHFYPSLFPEDGLFGRYPYLLPNLVAMIVIFLAILQGIFFLEETNPLLLKQDEPNDDEAIADETSSLLSRSASGRRSTTGRRISIVSSIRESAREVRRRPSILVEGVRDIGREVRRKPSLMEASLPAPTEQSFDIRRTSFGTVYSIRGGNIGDHARSLPIPGRTPQTPPKAFNKAVIMWIVALVIVAFHQMAFIGILPVYLLDIPNNPSGHLDLHGGLGYTVHDVGVYMAVNGILSMVIQGGIFPFFVEKIGVFKSLVWLTILYPVAYMVIPFISLLPEGGRVAAVYFVLALSSFFGIIVYPCALILLKDACPSPLVLGKVNGLAMSACCGARTISTPLVGIIYSVGGSAAAFWFCTAIAMIGGVQLLFIPRNEELIDKMEVEGPFTARKPSQIPIDEDAIDDS